MPPIVPGAGTICSSSAQRAQQAFVLVLLHATAQGFVVALCVLGFLKALHSRVDGTERLQRKQAVGLA